MPCAGGGLRQDRRAIRAPTTHAQPNNAHERRCHDQRPPSRCGCSVAGVTVGKWNVIQTGFDSFDCYLLALQTGTENRVVRPRRQASMPVFDALSMGFNSKPASDDGGCSAATRHQHEPPAPWSSGAPADDSGASFQGSVLAARVTTALRQLLGVLAPRLFPPDPDAERAYHVFHCGELGRRRAQVLWSPPDATTAPGSCDAIRSPPRSPARGARVLSSGPPPSRPHLAGAMMRQRARVMMIIFSMLGLVQLGFELASEGTVSSSFRSRVRVEFPDLAVPAFGWGRGYRGRTAAPVRAPPPRRSPSDPACT